jgi:hypothetical protein
MLPRYKNFSKVLAYERILRNRNYYKENQMYLKENYDRVKDKVEVEPISKAAEFSLSPNKFAS